MDLADRRIKGRTFCLPKWSRRRLIAPSAFFLAVIYYEELFMKLFCFHSLSFAGVFFTLIYSIPVAILFGLLCGGVRERAGRWLLVVCTGIISLWMGSQIVYYHLFKTFMTIFSLTKMLMVAQSFGNMAVGQVLMNWFPILMMVVPVVLALVFRKRIVAGPALERGDRLRWFGIGALVQVAGILLVLLCGGGNLSLRPRNWRYKTSGCSPRPSWRFAGCSSASTRTIRSCQSLRCAPHPLTRWRMEKRRGCMRWTSTLKPLSSGTRTTPL